jgi:hypothetical protein
VAVDDDGNIVTSTDPTGGASAWNVAAVAGANEVLGVSCPSASLCVATNDTGDVLTSTNPAGGASQWTLANVDGNDSLPAVSCPSATLCVTVDLSGNAVTSTDPTGGVSAWTATSVDDQGLLDGVSCPVVGLCVVVDAAGFVVAGTTPPAVTTGAAGSVTKPAATLAGSVNPNGLSVTDCHFSYGVGSPSGTNVPCASLPGAGTSDVAVSASVSGLTPGTTYQFRLVATSLGGTTVGSGGTFKTAPPSKPKPCVVPKLKGKTLKAVKRQLKSHSCRLGKVKHAASRTVKKGGVISQKPKAGKRLKHGAKVNLVVSRGRS